MTTRIRFPHEDASALSPSEADQVITLLNNVQTLLKGGEAIYAPITAWKTTDSRQASPYIGVVIEFTSTGQQTLGSGEITEAIGLYGSITVGGVEQRTLLGLLGVNLGATVPQIPCIENAAALQIGFSQILADVSVYDALSVGGVFNNIIVTGGGEDDFEVTAKIRPIRDREYIG